MAQPVVHFEIIGKEPAKLRSYFGELFGWEFDTSAPVAEAVSEPDDYGFVNRATTSDGTGIPGGVGGGAAYQAHAMFYVGVADVEAALQRAERLGGKRVMGPERAPSGLVVGHFTDPEGNLIGVAGPALPDRRYRTGAAGAAQPGRRSRDGVAAGAAHSAGAM